VNINSKSCCNAGFWAKHLQKTDTNEQVQIIGFYDLSAETIEAAFAEMRAMAKPSKNTKNYFSQYNINPRGDEHLTEAQWEEAHALHRKNHGLDHLPYFRVRHIKRDELGNLRVHEHGIALRVDPETGRAISDSLTAPINERTSRELEIRFDLERGHSVLTADREEPRPPRGPKKQESFRSERSGIDPETVKADARAARQASDNGQSFRAALEASGAYILAAGDRRDFVIIDRSGDDHSLGRRLGMKVSALRAFMADLDPASLPSVAEAKAMQEARRDLAREQQQSHLEHDSRKRRQMADDLDDDIASKQRQQRQAEEDRQAAIFNDMLAERNRADRFIQEWQVDHDTGERDRRHLQEAQWKREAEGDITDVRVRAIIAAGESRDFVQAVRREGAMITAEHAELQRQIAVEADPEKRQLLELRRDIQHADYMALANERVAAMSNLNSEQYKEAMRKQEEWAKAGTELRAERLELLERMARQERAATPAKQMAERINAADQQRADHRGDIRGPVVQDNQPPEAPREAVQGQYAAAGRQQGRPPRRAPASRSGRRK
jgi:hypothetical protein